MYRQLSAQVRTVDDQRSVARGWSARRNIVFSLDWNVVCHMRQIPHVVHAKGHDFVRRGFVAVRTKFLPAVQLVWVAGADLQTIES